MLDRTIQSDGSIVCKIKYNNIKYTSLLKLSYDVYYGTISDKDDRVKRECKNVKCINPEHLIRVEIGDWRKKELGKRYGKLVVIEYEGDSTEVNRYVTCRCDCGTIKNFNIGNIRRRSKSHIVSCGCIGAEKIGNLNKSHQKSNTRLYKVLAGAKSRCYSLKNPKYKHYGGRGVVCNEWLEDFESFYNWAIDNGYEDGLTLDRIDVNGNYEPSNCRWVEMSTQASNKQSTLWVTFEGETYCLHTLLNKLNRLNQYETIKRYIFRDGFTVDDALKIKNRTERSIMKFKYTLISNNVSNCRLHIYELGDILKVSKKTIRRYYDILNFKLILSEFNIEVYK